MPLDRIGLQKTTLLDFPGEVATTIFTPGCNLRCPYCHNPELVEPPYPSDMISLDELDAFLRKRAGVLGGVCITGGEPLLHQDINKLIQLIRSHGLKVKIDTNGTFPEQLAQIDADYIAMDLKTAPEAYHRLLPGTAGLDANLEDAILRSIRTLRKAGIPYELRTTVAPGIVDEHDLMSMLPLLPGAERFVLTPFRPGHTLDPDFSSRPAVSHEILLKMCETAKKSGVPCILREPPQSTS